MQAVFRGWCKAPRVALLRRELRTEKVVFADEAPIQRLAPEHGTTKTAYLLTYLRGEINGQRPLPHAIAPIGFAWVGYRPIFIVGIDGQFRQQR